MLLKRGVKLWVEYRVGDRWLPILEEPTEDFRLVVNDQKPKARSNSAGIGRLSKG